MTENTAGWRAKNPSGCPLTPLANRKPVLAPFTTQRSQYFGNEWQRRPLQAPLTHGKTDHQNNRMSNPAQHQEIPRRMKSREHANPWSTDSPLPPGGIPMKKGRRLGSTPRLVRAGLPSPTGYNAPVGQQTIVYIAAYGVGCRIGASVFFTHSL